MREVRVVKAIDRLEDAALLDPLVNAARGVVNTVVRPQWVRDLLHGVPFGHPLHPSLVQIPVGAWMSTAVLDTVPGTSRVARILVGVGVLGAIPAALSGYTDWSEVHEQQARVGIIHAAANITAVSLYAASFVQRGRGKQTSGKCLAYLGFAVVSASGFLGGHLSFRQAVGANHAEEIPHRFPPGWQSLGRLDELPDAALTKRMVAGLPLLVRRDGDLVDVLSNVCSHLSGPLDEGELIDDDGDPCVACPWHGSVFSLAGGEVVHGPATSPQPHFRTRIRSGTVEVLLPGAG